MNECEHCDRHDCRERGCIASIGQVVSSDWETEKKQPKDMHDQQILLISAMCRDAARKKLNALFRLRECCKRLIEDTNEIVKEYEETKNLDILYRPISNEIERDSEFVTYSIDDYIERIMRNSQEFQKQDGSQRELNRLRLILLEDVDFSGIDYWETLLSVAKESANKSKKRRR